MHPIHPPSPFFQKLTTLLVPFLHLPLLVAGDFNQIMDPKEDKSSGRDTLPSKHMYHSQLLPNFADGIHLTDVWGLTNPDAREYSFSHSHNTLTRIDYIFPNDKMLPFTVHPRLHNISISGHAPVSVSLTLFTTPSLKGTWPFPSYLAKDPGIRTLVKET